jgi:hypothetical protein
MKRLTTFLNKLQLRQVLTVLFVGILLFCTQACVDGGIAINPQEEVPSSEVTSVKEEGADTPKLLETPVKTKSEILTENAQESLVEKAIPVLDKNEDVQPSTKSTVEEVVVETPQQIENIPETVQVKASNPTEDNS